MDMIIIAYWTQTGNTKAMAEAVGEGVEIAGKKADVRHISEVSMDSLREAQVFAMGCPAMGAEVLEEGEMEPFVMEVEGFAQGKRIGLFGSYGWGDGQWMRDWEESLWEERVSSPTKRRTRTPWSSAGPWDGSWPPFRKRAFQGSLHFRKRHR